MATPGRLVEIMAKTLGVAAPTVVQYDRVLADNGLRSKGGRGNSAAQVTARDAANLLIAIMASPTVQDAARACRTYGRLPLAKEIPIPDEFAKRGLRCLLKLPSECSFAQAVERLILEVAEGGGFIKFDGESNADDMFRMEIRRPATDALFRIVDIQREPWPRIEFTNFYKKVLSGKLELSPPVTDMSQTLQVTYRTIRVLGNLVSGHAE
jgi:hypothetical protein